MLAATYFLPQIDMRWLYALLAVVAVVVIFPVMTMVMPTVVGCCAVVVPVIGKLLVGAAIIAAYAVTTKPRGK